MAPLNSEEMSMQWPEIDWKVGWKISIFKYILYVCLLLHIICDDMNPIYSLDVTLAPILCSSTLEAYDTSVQL